MMECPPTGALHKRTGSIIKHLACGMKWAWRLNPIAEPCTRCTRYRIGRVVRISYIQHQCLHRSCLQLNCWLPRYRSLIFFYIYPDQVPDINIQKWLFIAFLSLSFYNPKRSFHRWSWWKHYCRHWMERDKSVVLTPSSQCCALSVILNIQC